MKFISEKYCTSQEGTHEFCKGCIHEKFCSTVMASSMRSLHQLLGISLSELNILNCSKKEVHAEEQESENK